MTTATVVGSGPNGLAAAIRLAQAGVRVSVVEAADTPGGGARTSELTLPGVLHDECSTMMPGAVSSPFLRSLNLERHGLAWLDPPTVVAHPTHTRTGVLYRDLERTAAAMGPDGAIWRTLIGSLARHPDPLMSTAFGPMAGLPRHPLTFLQLGARALPPATWTAALFRREENAAVFGGVAAHLIGDLRRPMSSAVGIMLAATLHAHGWPFVRGGAGALTSALLAELAELGGTVELGRTVRRADEFDCDLVLLTVPPRTALRMVDAPVHVRRAWRRFTPGPGSFKLDLAIEGDVPWRDEACRDAGVVHLGGSMADVARAEATMAAGRMPERPFMLVTQPHVVDPTRSAGDVHPLWLYAHVPSGWPHDETETLLAQLEAYAPGVRERILAIHARGPLDLQAHNAAYLGGDIGGGANLARQLVARPRLGWNGYRTGVDGVYLAGASTSPGGGVHGMGGFNAAETALRDLAR